LKLHFINWLKKPYNSFFLLFIILSLFPLWIFRYFPSQDGPAHIYNAYIIRNYFHPGYPLIREYFILNGKLDPTWVSHLILGGLTYLFPISIVIKVFVSGYIILFPLSFRYALRALRPGAEAYAILSFPLIYNYPLHMGFFSFSFSLTLCVFILGYWYKHKDRFTLHTGGVLSALFILLYLFHVVSLVIVCLSFCTFLIWLIFFDASRKAGGNRLNFKSYRRTLRTRALIPALAFLPTFILAGIFFGQRNTATAPAPAFLKTLVNLIKFYSLVSFSKSEEWISTAFFVMLALGTTYLLIQKIRDREINYRDGILPIVGILILFYFIAPDVYLISPNGMAGGRFIKQRLNLYPFIFLILWIGTQHFHPNMKKAICIISAVITLTFLSLHTRTYADLNSYIDEYLSGAHLVKSHSTLLPISYFRKGTKYKGNVLSLRINPFLYASGYFACTKDIVMLNNYEANTGYFPVEFRPKLNPFIHTVIKGRLLAQPPWVNFIDYPKRTKGCVDYILIWGIKREHMDNRDPRTALITKQLKKGYKLIHTSKQRGLMHLYQRNDFSPF